MSYKAPVQHTVTSPKFLDDKIDEIQTAMGELSWMDKSFARAFKGVTEVGGNEVTFPEVYQGSGLDYLNVMPSDEWGAYSFVYVRQPQEVISYDDYFIRYSANIAIIIFFDLEDISTSYDYRFTELLKEDVLNKLHEIKPLELTETFDDAADVFADFSKTIERKYLQRKYGGLRIECSIEYENKCKTDNTY